MDHRAPKPVTLLIFCLLVAIAVVGRWGQADWCVTPLAAVGLFAGRWFDRLSVAALVPLTSMAISDGALASYDYTLVLVAVYLSMGLSAVWGRLLRRPASTRLASFARLLSCSVAPAIGFFVLTNFAVWLASGFYAYTFAGLVECYARALPFMQKMLFGDVAFTLSLFGLASVLGVFPVADTPGRAASNESARLG